MWTSDTNTQNVGRLDGERMRRSKFIAWARTSLSGHVALFEVVFGIPIALLMIVLNYTEGTLTFGWAVWIVGSCAAISIILAVAIWTTLTLPRIKRM